MIPTEKGLVVEILEKTLSYISGPLHHTFSTKPHVSLLKQALRVAEIEGRMRQLLDLAIRKKRFDTHPLEIFETAQALLAEHSEASK